MQKKWKWMVLAFLVVGPLIAQDAFHNNLQATLQSDYDLPAGNWVFFDNEAAILDAAGSYGGSYSTLGSTGTDFSSVVRAVIAQAGANPWDAGWNIRNKIAVRQGDKVLLNLSIRSIGGEGEVNIFAENSTTFAKEVILRATVSEEWTQYLIRFESSESYEAEAMTFGFHLAYRAQTLEIGGFTAINYGPNVDLSSLPDQLNNDRYGGSEADAPWRSAAAQRIEEIRKSRLDIEVKQADGTPRAGAEVQVKMLQHDFAFGSAITANRIAQNNAFNAIYQEKIVNLDGNGHGFNWIVFENDLKWPAWEDRWLVSRPELVNAVGWVRDQNIQIRGHTLVWPGASNMPNDISQNSTNIPFIRERIDQHLEEILLHPGIAGEIAEWDVLNEITTNRSLENYFRGQAGYPTGREILAEIFQKTREIDANTGLWLNDFVTLSLNSSPGNENYDNLKSFTRELLDAGADIEGIGFQGHIGGFPNGIPSVLETLDDFYGEFGLKAKITEFDLPSFVDEDLAGNYLRDFMTAIFSHESMNGFFFWSFWDGATYMNEGSNLFRLDWSQTPAGDAFIDLVFNQWWTDESVETDAEGKGRVKVFKGLHEIIYQDGDQTVIDTVYIDEDTQLEIVGGTLTTDRELLSRQQLPLSVYPNPATERLWIELPEEDQVLMRLTDLNGRRVLERAMSGKTITLDVAGFRGMYHLEVVGERGVAVRKVFIDR